MDAMSLFRMPLFFFLSGIFFSYSAKPKQFFIKKSEALLKPYFAVLLSVFFLNFSDGNDNILLQIRNIFYGTGATISWRWAPLWFLTHLFTIFAFNYILFRYFNFFGLSFLLKAIILLFFIVLGSLMIPLFWYPEISFFGQPINLPGLPFSLDLILITSFYFICGKLLNKKLIGFSPNIKVLIIFSILFILISIYTDAHMDLNQRIYKNPIFTTLGAFFGIYICICLSFFISKIKWISIIPLRLGEASLYILIFHLYIQEKVYSFFSGQISDSFTLFILAVFSFVLSISVPLVIKWVVVRSSFLSLAFLPFESNPLVKNIISRKRI